MARTLPIGWLVWAIFMAVFSCQSAARPSEQVRVREWRKHNVWPPSWQEESVGFKNLMQFREEEIMKLTGADERWENFLQFTQSRLVPKFTPVGFKVVQTPPEIHQLLANAVAAGVANWDNLRTEGDVDVIYNSAGMDPLFVDLKGLAWDALAALKPYHEEWIGGHIELKPTSAYGVRLYQNGSSLVMHYDRVETHVISSIVHIAHEYDNDEEPWPIQIEDHDGRLHSVNLEPGQMLFYESAKCLHGRMQKLKGKYYGSIFLHYQPVDKNVWDFDVEDVIAHVPPHWQQGITEDHGSRYSGACLTVDSRVAEGVPARKQASKHSEPSRTLHSEL